MERSKYKLGQMKEFVFKNKGRLLLTTLVLTGALALTKIGPKVSDYFYQTETPDKIELIEKSNAENLGHLINNLQQGLYRIAGGFFVGIYTKFGMEYMEAGMDNVPTTSTPVIGGNNNDGSAKPTPTFSIQREQ